MKILNTQNHSTNQIKNIGDPTDIQDAEVMEFRKQNGGYFWTTSTTQVNAGSSVQIVNVDQSTKRLYGTGVDSGNTTSLTLQPGIYEVSYAIWGDAQGGGELSAIELRLNTVAVPGTRIYAITGSGANETPTLANTTTLVVTAANSTLGIVNVSSVALMRNGTPSGAVTATINIAQVA